MAELVGSRNSDIGVRFEIFKPNLMYSNICLEFNWVWFVGFFFYFCIECISATFYCLV